MENKNLAKYLEALNGISYFEWVKLQQVVDSIFRKKDHEFKSGLELTVKAEEVPDIIRAQFG